MCKYFMYWHKCYIWIFINSIFIYDIVLDINFIYICTYITTYSMWGKRENIAYRLWR